MRGLLILLAVILIELSGATVLIKFFLLGILMVLIKLDK